MNLFKNKKTMSIDFGSSTSKIVEGKFSKKDIVIYKRFLIDIPDDVYKDGIILDIDQLGDILGQQLKENNLSSNTANGVINSSHIITREIKIPDMSYDEIKSLLSYQVEEYIPIRSEEYIVQFIILDRVYEDGIALLNLLLVGIPKDIVAAHLNLFKTLNIKPHSLDFQGNAIAKLINFNELINDSYSPEKKNIASIDIGYNNTKLILIEKGNIKVTRVVDMGTLHILDFIEQNLGIDRQELKSLSLNNLSTSKKIEEGSKSDLFQQIIVGALNTLLEKIELIFRYYRSRGLDNSIDLILLQGGIANIKGMEILFEDYFDIKSIKIDSLNNLNFTSDLLSRYSNAIGGLIRIDEV